MAGELVLLTGATGMIGFRVLTLLLEAGYKVRAAVRNQAGFDRITKLKPVAPYASQISSIIVPDITTPGAYDEAVKGVEYIVHVASPLASNTPPGVDFDSYLIQPAIHGTVGILESAVKTTGIKRIVITGSIMSIATPKDLGSGEYINEESHTPTTHGPFANVLEAYGASKSAAFNKTKEFVAERKPPFDVIHVFPLFVLGRDETVTTAEQIVKGTNNMLMRPLLGEPRAAPIAGAPVHLDDVARLHVLSLDPKVEGNQEFLAGSHSLEPFDWRDSIEIVKKHFPQAVADGVFKFEAAEKTVTLQSKVDSTKAEKFFGFKAKRFEEMVVSVVSHYLELLGKN
ncbi:nadp-binding domain-containing [Trichoderma arundinaceum]|uniref:Nadp-binding domain-containing n=1 Tax=Trichoderma arundinaceum TaxID=490622 RepID=A0A395NR39_TRIAR|nr:nadp-binding domain-containing [Trichoderma arundinaceum]